MNLENSKISFYSEGVYFRYQYPEKASDWLESIAQREGFSIGEINYIFCSDEYVLALNRTHLDHDYYTDILTFPYQKNPILSDIYISIDRVEDNAKQLKVSFEKELHRVIVHGLLHLIGYDDHSPEDIKAMRDAEEQTLRMFFEEEV